MVLMILAALLIGGIAFYQVAQGSFSAMIMAILTVLCAALAFNYYDPLGQLLAKDMGSYAHPAALLALFAVPLLGLRELFDRLIPGNVILGNWVDRVVGGFFGFITAMVLTGMFMIVFQMLPMPGKMLTYKPYDANLARKQGGPARWAGAFTLGLMKHLSAGALRPIMTDKKFAQVHDDLLLETFCERNRPKGGKTSAQPGALKALEAYVVKMPDREGLAKLSSAERSRLETQVPLVQDATPAYPPLSRRQADGAKVLVIRTAVDQSARHDEDGWFRLYGTQFRLVCKSGRSFYPVGYLDRQAGLQVKSGEKSDTRTRTGRRSTAPQSSIGEILVAKKWSRSTGPKEMLVDWVYRVPADEEPSQVIFRRTARASLPPVLEGLPDAP